MEQKFLLHLPELVIRVIQVLQVHKEHQVPVEAVVHKVLQEQLVLKVHKVIKDCREHKHILVRQHQLAVLTMEIYGGKVILEI